jgi:hypothetical protein
MSYSLGDATHAQEDLISPIQFQRGLVSPEHVHPATGQNHIHSLFKACWPLQETKD